jgi:hypothetical protein
MINHIWSLLCRRSVIDNETNNLSIFDILERLTVEIKIKRGSGDKVTKINIPIEYEIISFWVKAPETKEFKGGIKLEIISPDGKIEKTFEKPLEIPKDKKRLRSRIRIKGFVAHKEGNYIFRINYKEGAKDRYLKAAEIPLEVILKKELVDKIPGTDNKPKENLKN